MVFLLSVLNSIYYFVLNYGQGIAYMIDLICLMKFVCARSIQKQLYLPINDLKQDGCILSFVLDRLIKLRMLSLTGYVF